MCATCNVPNRKSGSPPVNIHVLTCAPLVIHLLNHPCVPPRLTNNNFISLKLNLPCRNSCATYAPPIKYLDPPR